MGKKYYCEYCDKSMVSTPSIVKTHNRGLVHQKIVQEHYQQFKDPETILREESKKKPCLRFPKGECSFGVMCRFSHYSREEISALQTLVAEKKKKKTYISQPSFEDLYQKLQTEKCTEPDTVDSENTVMYYSNGVTHIFPWTYNNSLMDNYGDMLPPSLKKFKLDYFNNVKFSEWG